MELFPAIDLRFGKAVRLRQGNYEDMQVYNCDPVALAREFSRMGARNLHVVDLDGAKDGKPAHFELIKEIAGVEGLFTQVGGGIRDARRVEHYLSSGVDRVIIGTAAINDPPFLKQMLNLYGEKIAVGVDAKDGFVAVNGWLDKTQTDSFTFCNTLYDMGVKCIIYTDISRDGELKGTNMPAYERLSAIKGLNIIASGGISFEHELCALRDIGTYGAIIGKALYENKLDLRRLCQLGF